MSRVLAPITSLADCVALSGSITTDVELARLEMVWKGVEAEIRRFCGQNIAQPADAYIDYLPETDWHVPVDPLLQNDYAWYTRYESFVTGGPTAEGHVLPLRQGLVRSITQIRIDVGGSAGTSGSDFGSTTVLDSSNYFLDVADQDPDDVLLSYSGAVISKAGNWPTRRRSIKVTYVAGLTGEELDNEFSDLRLAVCQEILDRYVNLSSGAGGARVKSERLGDWEISYSLQDKDSRLSQEVKDVLQPWVRYRLT